MDEHDLLAVRFEENRTHLRAVAFRMLGSMSEAEDAVQETWLRLSRSDTSGVENFTGWLTTVMARVCLSMLRSRRSRREDPIGDHLTELTGAESRTSNPEQEALLADSVGLALHIVLDTLTPAERLAFVLHDMFAVPYDQIGLIIERSPTAARQLTSRARRRVQGANTTSGADPNRTRDIVTAFLAASRNGDFEALLSMLDPDAVLRADARAVKLGAPSEVRGSEAVVRSFGGRLGGAQPALVDGEPGAVWAPGGRPRVVFFFTVGDGVISAIDLVADPERIQELALSYE